MELQFEQQLSQPRLVGCADVQSVQLEGDRQIAPNGDELVT